MNASQARHSRVGACPRMPERTEGASSPRRRGTSHVIVINDLNSIQASTSIRAIRVLLVFSDWLAGGNLDVRRDHEGN